MVRPKRFEEVDVINCPMQVERQHWVGLVIDLKKWEVIVLDCKREVLTDEQVEKYIEHITIMLPYLIRKHAVNERMLTQRLDRMTMTRPIIQCTCSSLGMFVFHFSVSIIVAPSDWFKRVSFRSCWNFMCYLRKILQFFQSSEVCLPSLPPLFHLST